MTNLQVYEYYKKQLGLNTNIGRYSKDTLTKYFFYLDKAIQTFDTLNIDMVTARKKHIMQVVEHLNLTTSANNSLLTALTNFYDILMNSSLYVDEIDYNPAKDIKRIKETHHIKKPLTTDEVNILVSNVKNVRNKAVLAIMLNAGLRATEVIHLTLAQYQNRDENNCIILTHTKGSKTRICYLNNDCIQAIDDYLSTRNSDSELLFVSNQGTPLDSRVLNRSWKKIAEKCGIENTDIANHNMRKTCATNMLNNGVDVMAVKEVLGHSNVATTMIYASLNPTTYLKMIGAR